MNKLVLKSLLWSLFLGIFFLACSSEENSAEEAKLKPETKAATTAQASVPKLTQKQIKFFEAKIRPLLHAKCIDCHGPDEQEGDLRLDNREDAMVVGGPSGDTIVPGKPEKSSIIEAVKYESLEMPPDEPLSEAEIKLLENWIKQGAHWPDDKKVASNHSGAEITEEDRNYWAFKSMVSPSIPEVKSPQWCSNDVDLFILRRLEKEKIAPNSAASKRDLLRRVTYGLTGLAPTKKQFDDFLNDKSSDAYEKVVDRLLASPEYGEHIARGWLDLVRYAESDGYRADGYRPTAWRYRDYVIDSFNEDKPYNRFLTEQLAGDEIAPEDPQAIIATAFLRLGVYEYNQRDVRTQWQDILNEMTDVTADVFIGLGMGCARCHNHKFDPLLQKDYFALQAFLSPVIWKNNVPLATKEQIAEYQQKLAVWEEATKEIRKKIDAIEKPLLAQLKEAQTVMFPDDVEAMMRKPVAEREPIEHQLAELAWLQVIDQQKKVKGKIKGEKRKVWDALQVELSKHDGIKPSPLPVGPSVVDVGKQAPPTWLPSRRKPEKIAPQFIQVISRQQPQFLPPPKQETTGRRTALANWLTQDDHPMTSRVMVNRIWQHHFGVGLVSTSSDFGSLGDPPTHPELLDWLAIRFINEGWSIKKMHRLMVTSSAYKQSSHIGTNSENVKRALLRDPQNSLIWRMTPHRLNADQIRDSILTSTGELSLKKAGASVSATSRRRSIYTKVIRNNQDLFFTAFDAPRGTSSTSERNVTTTSTQALLLLNSDWAIQRGRTLAKRAIQKETDGENLSAMINRLYEFTLQRTPSQTELAEAAKYIKQVKSELEVANKSTKKKPAPKEKADQILQNAVTDFAHVLLNCNEFLYVD